MTHPMACVVPRNRQAEIRHVGIGPTANLHPLCGAGASIAWAMRLEDPVRELPLCRGCTLRLHLLERIRATEFPRK